MLQTVTMKVQIYADAQQKQFLLDTLQAYKEACNFVSAYIFSSHDLKQASLNRALYHTLRDRFSLRSQMAQSVLKTVIARYKSILAKEEGWIRPQFQKFQYDLVWNRDYSLTDSFFSVNTLEGRVKVPYASHGMEPYFDHSLYIFGTAKLVFRKGKFYLHIPVSRDLPDVIVSDIRNVAGIDVGVNFLAACYDSAGKTTFYNGHAVKHKRIRYQRMRRKLQAIHTASARRCLKCMDHRENRWMQDVNHCISKALVSAQPKGTLFVLEDLTGIARGKSEPFRKYGRHRHVSWAFYDLQKKIEYKALRNGCMVLFVDPAYTSQRCPKCGHIEKENRSKERHTFCCKNCSYQSNDDRIGAMNLYQKGLSWLEQEQVRQFDTVAG